MRRSLGLAGALLTFLAATPAHAAPPAPGPLAVAVIRSYLLPRYDALVTATAAQAEAWDAACADGDAAPDAAALRERYQEAADAWAAVEHLTTGPISLALRPERIFFFPDKRNAVAKALTELEDRAKDADIPHDAFRGGSVAGQGFPALERLLFEPDVAASPAVRCRVGVAIARNLAALSADVTQEWRADTGPLAKLDAGQGDPVHFADPAQAAARLMTDLAGGLQRAVDLKLLPVLGSSAEAARPKSAEGWRSARTARSIRVAAASLAAMEAALAKPAPQTVAGKAAKAFDAARAAADRLPDDVGDAAADPKRRKAIEATVAAFKAAQASVVKDLAPALGVPLGFNSLDGD